MRENEYLGRSDGIKPFLDPTPHSWEEGGRTNDLFVLVSSQLGTERSTNENSIQSFRVMRCSKCRSILHMRSQVPKLLQANPRNIHDIIALCYGCSWMVAINERRAKWHHKTDQVLVEGKKSQELRRYVSICFGLTDGSLRRLLVCSHCFRVQMLDFENVHGNTTTITSASPLGILLEVSSGRCRRGLQTNVPASDILRIVPNLSFHIARLCRLSSAIPQYPRIASKRRAQ